MKLKLVLGCLALLMFFHFDALSQRKKKNPYEGYWEQQEKQEQFDKVAKDAHVLFQSKKFEQAKIKYQEALKIIPTDQRVIAKVRDIDLLIEKQKQAQLKEKPTVQSQPETEIPQEIPDTLTLYLNEPKTDKIIVKDTVPAKALIPQKNVSEAPPIKDPKIVSKKPATKKIITPKAENPKPYKNTENYRKYLTTLYKPGWTEEKYNEGTKEITKRVFVKEKYGEEYLMVKHHYGAVYYFKNGASISYATWIAETEKKPK